MYFMNVKFAHEIIILWFPISHLDCTSKIDTHSNYDTYSLSILLPLKFNAKLTIKKKPITQFESFSIIKL